MDYIITENYKKNPDIIDFLPKIIYAFVTDP
jgi:hypothetical protein